MVTAMNVTHAAKDTITAPGAVMDSGVMDLVLMKDVGCCSMVKALLSLDNGSVCGKQHVFLALTLAPSLSASASDSGSFAGSICLCLCLFPYRCPLLALRPHLPLVLSASLCPYFCPGSGHSRSRPRFLPCDSGALRHTVLLQIGTLSDVEIHPVTAFRLVPEANQGLYSLDGERIPTEPVQVEVVRGVLRMYGYNKPAA